MAKTGGMGTMIMEPFEALVVDHPDGEFRIGTRMLRADDLPAGELLIEVSYSSVNYKDALACQPKGNIIQQYPFVPGIDLAGVVVESKDDRFQNGDEVLVTGFELGVSHFGGFSRYARVPALWTVKLPKGLSLKESMILGTAGFTAALSVHELGQSGIRPDDGPILVTGASGGVGSTSVAILSRLGYEVIAATGKADMKDVLLSVGASRVISREALIPDKPRPIGKQVWAGAIDCVGGPVLAAVLSGIKYGGAVVASGLTGGSGLVTTVFPFILRGVRLIGIDSVYAPMPLRLTVWDRLGNEFKPSSLQQMHTEISLEHIPEAARGMIEGKSRGRVLVKIR